MNLEELSFLVLGEISALKIIKNKKPQENKNSEELSLKGAQIAKEAKKKLEQEIGKQVTAKQQQNNNKIINNLLNQIINQKIKIKL